MTRPLTNLLTALALLPLAGCYSYRAVVVTVVDAETGRPIHGAKVATHYEVGMAHVSPVTSRGTTDQNGTARVCFARDPAGIFVNLRARGYLDYWAGGVLPNGRPYDSSPYTELPRWPFRAVTLTLYAKPAPEVVLVVPDGYRGLVPVSERDRRGNPSPGRRRFEVDWRPGTTARMTEVPRMTFTRPTVSHVRYASGAPVPARPNGMEEVGWWWTGTGERPAAPDVTGHILIGTREEYRGHSERVVAPSGPRRRGTAGLRNHGSRRASRRPIPVVRQ